MVSRTSSAVTEEGGGGRRREGEGDGEGGRGRGRRRGEDHMYVHIHRAPQKQKEQENREKKNMNEVPQVMKLIFNSIHVLEERKNLLSWLNSLKVSDTCTCTCIVYLRQPQWRGGTN